MFKIVSFYTVDTPYENIIKQYLLPSVEKLNLLHEVYVFENMNSWRVNTNLKSTVCDIALDQEHLDIIFLDADCTVNSYPELFNEIPQEYDIALHWFDGNLIFNNGTVPHVASGTLFFRNRKICKDIIKRWEEACWEENNKFTDQKVLENVLKEFPDVKIYNLPLEYCWLHDLPNRSHVIPRPDNVIIEHYQSSRTTKKQIGL